MRARLRIGLAIAVLFGTFCGPTWAGVSDRSHRESGIPASIWTWVVNTWQELIGIEFGEAGNVSPRNLTADSTGICLNGHGDVNPPQSLCTTDDPDDPPTAPDPPPGPDINQ
jgi:hypothetical protein